MPPGLTSSTWPSPIARLRWPSPARTSRTRRSCRRLEAEHVPVPRDRALEVGHVDRETMFSSSRTACSSPLGCLDLLAHRDSSSDGGSVLSCFYTKHTSMSIALSSTTAGPRRSSRSCTASGEAASSRSSNTRPRAGIAAPHARGPDRRGARMTKPRLRPPTAPGVRAHQGGTAVAPACLPLVAALRRGDSTTSA